jgi:hypothetical protein
VFAGSSTGFDQVPRTVSREKFSRDHVARHHVRDLGAGSFRSPWRALFEMGSYP